MQLAVVKRWVRNAAGCGKQVARDGIGYGKEGARDAVVKKMARNAVVKRWQGMLLVVEKI